MAQTLVTDSGSLITPGAYAGFKVQTNSSGLSTSGVLMLIGEADAGPDFTLETDLQANSFGPDQISAIIAKYRSGPIVDAFNAAAQPSNDPSITGSPTAFIIVKTNASGKASSALNKIGGGTYATLFDKSYGLLGNLINVTVSASQAEVAPSTGLFTYIPPTAAGTVEFHRNGAIGSTASFANGDSPATFIAAVAADASLSTSGGVLRTVIPGVSGTLALAASGNQVTITYSGTYNTTPSIGDTLMIPTSSVIKGAGNQNIGGYIVTAATSTVITATKLSDGGKASPTPGVITAPAAVSAVSVAATTDFSVYSPISIGYLSSAAAIDGVGKALEIVQPTSGSDNISRMFYTTSGTPVTFISASAAPQLIVSASEYIAQLNNNRQSDNVTETITAGGGIALTLGYASDTATVTISSSTGTTTPDTLTTTVTGGIGANLNISLKSFGTLNDLAAFINAQTGYSCAVGNATLGQMNPSTLDMVTGLGIGSRWGAKPGRIKADAFKFFTTLSQQSGLVQLGNVTPARAALGLPAVNTVPTFLAGGSRGGTTNAIVSAALVALQKVQGNFIVPLFSRDATLDIADGLTDSTSTYLIDSINAACSSHVNAVSTLKARKNRQAFLSKKDTYANVKIAAANIANFRCTMSFLDQKVVGSDGTIKQFQPWMDAAVCAGMQAAGFYKSVVHKFKNVSGSLQAAGDWSDQVATQVDDALLAGLLPTAKSPTGGYYYISDQTTYARDPNFVFNSVQAVYAADTVAMTTALRMENAFVGQSLADVSAGQALSFLEGVMSDFRRLKLIAPSDDAMLGYRNAKVAISGPAMLVGVDIRLATSIYFVKIDFLIGQVTQTAR